MDISIQQEIKSKFRNGAVCPHCGSKDINKFGFFNGKQRYRCKECRKTFNLYTKTLLSWSHYKDKWESFIETMGKDMSLRQAEQQIGVSYSALFYWRHKIMSILNEEIDSRLHGTLELMDLKLKYLDKYRNRKEEENFNAGGDQNVIFAFLYQRDNRLNSYIYKERKGPKPFIDELSDNIDENSIICLYSNYPFRYPLLYKKIRVADKKKYKRINYFNTNSVRKYLGQFRCWIKMFRGVSSKNLPKYAAFFKTHMIFNNMECIILCSLREYESLINQYAAKGVFGF
ncbi:MAG: transposase [Clostridiaceae bacterium]